MQRKWARVVRDARFVNVFFANSWLVRRWLATAWIAGLLISSGNTGCQSKTEQARQEVVVYSALDRVFSEPVLERYGADKNVDIRLTTDVESTKTIGLVNRLLEESSRPRCDLFWNNEILNTIRLQKRGLLLPYSSAEGSKYPDNYRAQDGSWFGFAARARVLIVNSELVSEDQLPRGIEDLVNPKWKGKVGIAKPLFGTTSTHAAVLYSLWGPERTEAFFRELKQNAKVLSGNKQVATAVARGELAFGLTDTDDTVMEIEQGFPVKLVYPDQHEGGMGTLFIPNTLGLIRNGPNPQGAKRLLDYLLRHEVEAELVRGPSAQFAVHPEARQQSRLRPPTGVRWLEVDFYAAADNWEASNSLLRELFEQ